MTKKDQDDGGGVTLSPTALSPDKHPDIGEDFLRWNEEARCYERVSMLTGEVLARPPSTDEKVRGHYLTKELRRNCLMTKHWNYTPAIADHIVQLISEGRTLSEISKMQGMPSSSVIAKWQKESEDFKSRVVEARKVRAERFHDAVVEASSITPHLDKDSIPAAKLHFEQLKWLSMVGDPTRYGNKTTIGGDSNAPVTFLVKTGIVRSPEQEALLENPREAPDNVIDYVEDDSDVEDDI